MIKGYQRALIMIRTKESSFFESAFFILRKPACTYSRKDEMISEATRIINENEQSEKKKRELKIRHILIFAGIGFLVGAMTVGAVWLAVI
jgi:hypothetical protein